MEGTYGKLGAELMHDKDLIVNEPQNGFIVGGIGGDVILVEVRGWRTKPDLSDSGIIP